MGEFISASAMHKQYAQAVAAFRKLIPDPVLRMEFGRQVDDYMRTCALGVWQADNASAISPRHVEYYNGIYSSSAPTSALFWEVASGVAGYDLFAPPAFFDALCHYDRRKGTSLARRFCDQLTLMMLLFAAVDGVVSEAEAGFVNSCSDQLLALCDGQQLPGDRPALKANDFVTAKPADRPQPQSQGDKPAAGQAQQEEAPIPPPNLDELLTELDDLCGLDEVKRDVKSLINLVKVQKLRQEADLPVAPMSLHLVFLGNPGTGKTTVARLLSKIYHAIGALSKGQLVEVDRSGLVAGFVGQTAIKTGEVIQKALGGVLFIDEAYSLSNQESANDFGREAIEVLLKGMEDNRKDLVVIVAGYSGLMEKFIHSNPGLESRFNKYFFFQDYTGDQLMEIFQSMCTRHGYTLTPEARQWASTDLQELYDTRDENFGNARDVRNLFEQAISRQSNRVAQLESPTRDQLMELWLEDLREEEESSPDGKSAQAREDAPPAEAEAKEQENTQ